MPDSARGGGAIASHPFRAVVFDFDYTLADSSPGVVACVDYALQNMGLPPAEPEAVCRTIGLTLADTFSLLTGSADAKSVAEFTRLFVEHADRVMVDLTRIYPGVPDVVGPIRRWGLKVGIVSSKYRYRIEWTLERGELLHLFDVIVGGEDVVNLKPHPDGLLMAIQRLGVARDETLYVGDSATDAEAAARAGIPFAWVRSGTTTLGELGMYPLYAQLDDLSGLLTLLSGDDQRPRE